MEKNDSKTLSIKKTNALAFVAAILGFIVSLVILPWHEFGDQLVYNKIYLTISDLNFLDALDYYQQNLASVELTHFIYSYFFSYFGVNKIYAISFVNSLLIFLTTKLIYKHFNPPFFIVFFIISNYYILSIFFTLERLKFGVVFVLLALLNYRNKILRILFFIISVLSHFSCLLFLSLYLSKSIRVFSIKYIFLFIVFFISSYLFFIEHVTWKIAAYFLTGDREILNFTKVLLYLFASFFVLGRISFGTFFTFLPLFILSLVIEPDRIAFFAYFFFIYFCFISNMINRSKICLFITSIYYSFSGFSYIYMLSIYGG